MAQQSRDCLGRRRRRRDEFFWRCLRLCVGSG